MKRRTLVVGAFVMCALSGAVSAPLGAAVRAGSGDAGVVRYGYDLETTFTNLDPGKSTNSCDKNVWLRRERRDATSARGWR